MSPLIRTIIAEGTALSLHCFQDGQESLERVVRNRLDYGRLLPPLKEVLETYEELLNVIFKLNVNCSRLSVLTEDVGPMISQWTMSAGIGHFRGYVAGVDVNQVSSTRRVRSLYSLLFTIAM